MDRLSISLPDDLPSQGGGKEMLARAIRSIYEDGQGGRIGVPKVFLDGMGLRHGDKVEVYYDDVLVIVPKKTAQSERVLAAMREGC